MHSFNERQAFNLYMDSLNPFDSRSRTCGWNWVLVRHTCWCSELDTPVGVQCLTPRSCRKVGQHRNKTPGNRSLRSKNTLKLAVKSINTKNHCIMIVRDGLTLILLIWNSLARFVFWSLYSEVIFTIFWF